MPLLETDNLQVILASQSPRRHELLQKIITPFEIQASEIEETNNYTNPADIVTDLSRQKALKVSEQRLNSVVIGADSIVVLDSTVLGKPKDKDEAFWMLNLLSDKVHQVFTGFTIIDNRSDVIVSDYEVTKVKFRALQSWEIVRYIDVEQPFDKAGSYGIQDSSAVFVEWIHGCYFNVVGLPLTKLYMRLLPIFKP
jgi:septum formation protein